MTRSAFQRCVAKHRAAHGDSWDDAAAICRGERPAYNPEPLPRKQVQEVGPASSVGPGWRSQGANIGTGAVMEPDAKEIARSWATATGTRDRTAWAEHAKRMGCSPDGVEAGWNYIRRRDNGKEEEAAAVATFETLQKMRRAEEKDPAAIATLRKIFGESVSWSGHWVLNKGLMDPKSDDELPPIVQPPKKSKKRAADVVEMDVMGVKTHQAPQVGNVRGQSQNQKQDPGFPFRTLSAQKVWEKAQELIAQYPLKTPAEIILAALETLQIPLTELTPEDEQLLRMAVQYFQNGPPVTNVRTGGTPGGPFRSQFDAHMLGIRGTFGLP